MTHSHRGMGEDGGSGGGCASVVARLALPALEPRACGKVLIPPRSRFEGRPLEWFQSSIGNQQSKIGSGGPGGIAFGHASVRCAGFGFAREARSCVRTQGLRQGPHPSRSRFEERPLERFQSSIGNQQSKIGGGGPGGIRTLGTLLKYAPLAKVCFRPLSHRSMETRVARRLNTAADSRQPSWRGNLRHAHNA